MSAPGHKGGQHWLHKRWQQMQQTAGERQGTRVATAFADEFTQMKKATLAIEKSYKKINDRVELYLQPDPTKRINTRLFSKKEQVLTDEQVDKEPLSKVGEAMVEVGQAFGEETSLGALYTVVGETQRELTRNWLTFQFNTNKTYLKPIMVLYEDLKSIKARLEKIEKDRLYLDATKARGQAAKRDVKNFDPTVARHLERKAQQLQESLEEQAGDVQTQMEQFFYELEDDQMQILHAFIRAEIEYYRSSLEALSDVANFVNDLASQPTKSIVGHERDDALGTGGAKRARALYDFNATNADELSFRQDDILDIVAMEGAGDGWWTGAMDGEQGYIPSSYVELLPEAARAIEIMQLPRLDSVASLPAGGARRTSKADVAATGNRAGDEAAARERDRVAREVAELKAEKERMSRELQQMSKQRDQAAVVATRDLLGHMFGTAVDMALRQAANTRDVLRSDAIACQRPDFKPNSADFDSAFNGLMNKAQDIMNVVKGLLKDAQKGDLAELQVAVTSAIEELQRLALEAKLMSSALLRPSDRDQVLRTTGAIVDSLEAMLRTIKQVAGKDKDAVKAALGPVSKQAAGSIGALLDVMDAARTAQAKEMELLKQQAQKATVEHESDLLNAARAIARVAEELALMARASSTAAVHKGMVGEALQVTGSAAKLVEVATECQRIISSSATTSSTDAVNKYFNDGTWSEGLVSAAKMVAEGVEDLSRAAGDVVAEGGDKVDLGKVDRLRAVAQTIKGSTVQVVMAGSTRNPDRALHRRLQDAANEVQRAVDHMISDIDANKAYGNGVRDVSAMSATQRRRAEIEAQAKILQAQRELELAQQELMALRKGRYADSATSDSVAAPPAPKSSTPPPPPSSARAPAPPAAAPAADSDEDDFESEMMARLNRLKRG